MMKLGLVPGSKRQIIGSAIDISVIMILEQAFDSISVKRTVSSYRLAQDVFLKQKRVPHSLVLQYERSIRACHLRLLRLHYPVLISA